MMQQEELGSGDPSAVLAELEHAGGKARKLMAPDARFLYGVWGIAWVVGFGAIFLTQFPRMKPVLPATIGLVLGAGALTVAILVTSIHATRRNAGLRGPSSARVAIHGNTFAVAFGLLGLLGWRLHAQGLQPEAMVTFWVVGACLVVGMQFLCGAALWGQKSQLIFGVWTLLVGLAAVFMPVPLPLLAGVLGGVGFLVFAAVEHLRPASLSGSIGKGSHD